MSTVTSSNPTSDSSQRRWHAYVELTKLRISIMVLLTFACAAVVAAVTSGQAIGMGVMVYGLLGMLLIASSGNAMNMYLERYSDFLMPRTAGRPLPAGQLGATEVVTFAAITCGAGFALLLAGVNWQTAVCGLANWLLYVFVYTPLKRVTPWNTEIGAVAGAMPVIMGALATTGTVGLVGWSFFGVLFLWQFPHFFAIAWMYREQYQMGGLRMLTVTEPTGRLAAIKSMLAGGLLIPVSLLPLGELAGPIRGWIFGVSVVVLGILYLLAGYRFYLERNGRTSRKLLHASLLYLPLYMLVLMAVNLI